MPNTPDGNPFSAGFDPHTITVYTSPNTGRAVGLYSDWLPADTDVYRGGRYGGSARRDAGGESGRPD